MKLLARDDNVSNYVTVSLLLLRCDAACIYNHSLLIPFVVPCWQNQMANFIKDQMNLVMIELYN